MLRAMARHATRPALARGRRRLSAWRRSEDGASAVEFALLAPVLFLALLATADVGLALYERMTIDHVLRSGAQSAMNDPGEEAVIEALEAVAAQSYSLVAAGEAVASGQLAVSAARYCACPEDKATPVACTTSCSGGVATYVYYRLEAEGGRDGMLIPRIDFNPAIQVQVQ